MSLTGMDFVIHYEDMLDELDKSMASEYREIIFRYRFQDPHDLVDPDGVFSSKKEMINYLRNLIWIGHIENDPTYRN